MFMFYDNGDDDKKIQIMNNMTKLIEELISSLEIALKHNETLILKQKIKDNAHKTILDRFLELIECGDCGHWGPETEEQVIESRRVLEYPKS